MRLALTLSLLITAACFVDRPLPHFTRAGVELRKAETYEAPAGDEHAVVVAPGDFVLSGGDMRVVIGGLRREHDARGAVLEAAFSGVPAAESIALLAPRLYVGGVAHDVRIERMFVVERGGAPALRSEGVVMLRDRVIQIAQELSLGRTPGTLSTSTRLLTLEKAGERDVRLGARVAWGGPRPFLPGQGELADENWHRAPWVGSEGATSGTCFGYERGSLSVRAAFEHANHRELLLHTEITQARSFELTPGKPHYEKSVLVVAPDGIARAVRSFGLWRGAGFPEVWVHLPFSPPGSQVELYDREQRLLLRGRPDAEGKVVLPRIVLEATSQPGFQVVATAFGHAPSDVVQSDRNEGSLTLLIPRGGRIRVRARSRHDDSPISARVRIIALGATRPLSLGPDFRASGAGDTVIALAGDSGVDVPPGRYRVLVTHGPEWSLHEQEVDVSETFGPRIDARLEQQVDPSSWVACDLHLHAAPSPDSEVSLEDRLASLAAEGIAFAVPTDHNHVTDYAPVAERLSLDLRTVTGVEVTTWEPSIGHFNAYPYPLDPDRPDRGALDHVQPDPGALFKQLHAIDPELIVQVNHPRSEGGIGYFDVMRVDTATGAADPRYSGAFDAIEVYNGFDLAQPERLEQVFRDWLNIVARGHRIVATGSSDSHQVRYQLAGYPRTYVQVPPSAGLDPRAVVRAIKAGASFVTTGPFLEATIGGGGPGTTVSAQEGRVKLEVRVQAPTWMEVDRLEVFVGTELVLTRELPRPRPGRLKKVLRLDAADLELKVSTDTFVVARVSGGSSPDTFFGRNGIMPRAFTNPIFVDADGDGRTPWTPGP
jgi:predicted metal-dependent phosphoesterase TrpH